MSQTIIIQEDTTTLEIATVVSPSRDPLQTSKIRLPVGGGPLVFCDENDTTLLTLDVNGNLVSAKGFFELAGQAEPDVSGAGKTRLYFDSTANQLMISEDGGAYGPIQGMSSIPDPLELGEYRVKPGATVIMSWLEDDTFVSGKPLFTTDSGGIFFDADGSRNGILQIEPRLLRFHGSGGAEKGLIQDSDSSFTIQSGPGAELIIKSRETDSASAVAIRLISETALVTAGAKFITVENGTTLKRYTDKDGLFHFPFTGNPSEQGMWFPKNNGTNDSQFLGRSGDILLARTDGLVIETKSGTNGRLFSGIISNDLYGPRLNTGIMRFNGGILGVPGDENEIASFTTGSGSLPTIDRRVLRIKKNGIEVPFSNMSDVSNQIFDSFLIRLTASYWNGSSGTDRKFELVHEMLSTTPSSRLDFKLDGTTVAEVWDDGSVRLNTNGGTKPTAAAAHRGKLFVEQGGAGVTDRYFVCLKSAADTYSWVEVVNGG